MWGALLGGLINIAGTLAGRVLLAVGISVATYTGLSTSIDFLKQGAITAFLGLPPQIIGMLSLMKVGSCVSMVISAIVIKMTLDGLKGGVLTKWTK